MPGRLFVAAASSALTGLLLLGTAAWGGAEPEDHLARLKSLQQRLLMQEPMEKREESERIERFRERFRKWRTHSARLKGGQRLRPAEGLLVAPRGPSALAPEDGTDPLGATAPSNVLVNRRIGEPEGAVQSEVSIAAFGNFVVAAWNDGIGIYGSPHPPDTQGFGYSTDGGLTWTDGGVPPTANVRRWTSDPVVVVNQRTGAFYYAGLCEPSVSTNGVGVVKGTFCGNSFTWETPTLVRSAASSSALLDKHWLAVDPLSGNLYLSYSHFVVQGGRITSNEIRFERSTDENLTWGGVRILSTPGDAGFVQGSRPTVGPDGELYVVWHAIGQSAGPRKNSPFGRDFLRVRKSTDGGATFDAEVTADSVFSNFGSGAPGFNRGIGITFPGIAVDHTTGPSRGRVYLTWNESLNFYNDRPPDPRIDPSTKEVEPNNQASQATLFVPGVVLRGAVSTTGNPGDHDYWEFNGTQGQTVIFWLDSLSANLDAAFRILCTDGVTLLAFSQNGVGGEGVLVFTLPADGNYYVRVASWTGARTGGYRILTYVNSPQNDRARDHRDVFVKSSDDGETWGPTVRVSDGPGLFDDWLPEVGVDGLGRVFVAHYDFRNSGSICGGGSDVYLARSNDGGTSWFPEVRMSDQTTDWTNAFSTLIPNQGDYIALLARDPDPFVAWGDGRNGDPDIYATPGPLACVPAPVSGGTIALTGKQEVTVTWSAPAGFEATLFRRPAGGPEADLGMVTADGSGRIVHVGPGLEVGETYAYRLGVQGFCVPSACELSITIPCDPAPVAIVGSQSTTESVTVTWSAPEGLTARLQRREEPDPYQDAGPVTAVADRIVFQDDAVTPGRRYGYRLEVAGFCERFVGEVGVTVPGAEVAIQGLGPNPARDQVWVTYSLASAAPAALQLLDITGRKVHEVQLRPAYGGPQPPIDLIDGVSVRAGVYFVRVAQGGSAKLKRVAILP